MKLKSKYWIISDTHFGHDDIISFCNRPKDFELRILNGLKSNVSPDDIIIHLGDVFFGPAGPGWHQDMMSIKCLRKWLILGNHDRKSNYWYMKNGWDCVVDKMFINLYGKNILFSHKPSKDDGYDINIHGHFHNISHHRHEPELVAIKNDKQYLISMENTNYQPVHLLSILEKI